MNFHWALRPKVPALYFAATLKWQGRELPGSVLPYDTRVYYWYIQHDIPRYRGTVVILRTTHYLPMLHTLRDPTRYATWTLPASVLPYDTRVYYWYIQHDIPRYRGTVVILRTTHYLPMLHTLRDPTRYATWTLRCRSYGIKSPTEYRVTVTAGLG